MIFDKDTAIAAVLGVSAALLSYVAGVQAGERNWKAECIAAVERAFAQNEADRAEGEE